MVKSNKIWKTRCTIFFLSVFSDLVSSGHTDSSNSSDAISTGSTLSHPSQRSNSDPTPIKPQHVSHLAFPPLPSLRRLSITRISTAPRCLQKIRSAERRLPAVRYGSRRDLVSASNVFCARSTRQPPALARGDALHKRTGGSRASSPALSDFYVCRPARCRTSSHGGVM